MKMCISLIKPWKYRLIKIMMNKVKNFQQMSTLSALLPIQITFFFLHCSLQLDASHFVYKKLVMNHNHAAFQLRVRNLQIANCF